MDRQVRVPLLAISGESGSGKTTLLEKVVEQLAQNYPVRVAVIKHTHHDVKIDKPGKDSWRMTQAGAKQVMIASRDRWAVMTETPQMPSLHYLAEQFDSQLVDLVLVEGFKHEAVPKLLVHRKEFIKPLPPIDEHVIGIVSDYQVELNEEKSGCIQLDINEPQLVAEFVYQWWKTNCS